MPTPACVLQACETLPRRKRNQAMQGGTTSCEARLFITPPDLHGRGAASQAAEKVRKAGSSRAERHSNKCNSLSVSKIMLQWWNMAREPALSSKVLSIFRTFPHGQLFPKSKDTIHACCSCLTIRRHLHRRRHLLTNRHHPKSRRRH